MESKFILIGWHPVLVDWDFDRFSDSVAKRESPGKYFSKTGMGFLTKPTTLVDSHGKILMWYLPGLLLPSRVVCSASLIQNLFFLLTFSIARVQCSYGVP